MRCRWRLWQLNLSSSSERHIHIHSPDPDLTPFVVDHSPQLFVAAICVIPLVFSDYRNIFSALLWPLTEYFHYYSVYKLSVTFSIN